MTANTSLRVTELDFDSIKQNLKEYLRGQSQFQDFDFDGSGMSVLLDILSYNTHYMSYYLNMVANESFLDTAQLRTSVISHAKAINYVPESRHGASTTVDIVITPSSSESSNTVATLEKYTRILGTDIDGVNYPFVVLNSSTEAKSNGSFTWYNVEIAQGEVITLQYLMDSSNVKRRFNIPSANVDIDTVTVFVQTSTTNTTTVEYIRAGDVTELDGTSKVYFIEEDGEGTYVIYFGDNIIGKKPDNGNVIIVNYLDTVGEEANKISTFSFAQPVTDGLFRDNTPITADGPTFGGTEKETISDVRFRAPYAYAAQNRAVTKSDYETLISKDYEYINSVSVWGGEDNDPPIYGKVFVSLKTKDNYFLTNDEKLEITNKLIKTRNVMTVTPEIVDPSYTYIQIRGNVYYNSYISSASASSIKAYVLAAITDYNDTEINFFNSVFRKSKLQKYIENSYSAITGSDIRTFLQKRFIVTPNETKTYVVSFNVPIKRGDYTGTMTTYPQLTVTDGNFIDRKIYFEEVPSSATGILGIKIVNPGINYITAPTIVISGDGSGATATARIAGNRISAIEITNKGVNYSRATVNIVAEFGTEAQTEILLETRFATIRSYYIDDTGKKIIVHADAGTVDYEEGTITLNSLNVKSVDANDLYDENVFTISVPIDQEVIFPLRNRILNIDETDPSSIQINVITE